MQKTLCFDFGNTRYKCGVMQDGSFIKEIILNNDISQIQQLLQQEKPDNAILASVVNHDEAIENVIKEYGHFVKVSSECKLNITVPSGQEKTVGADRWAMLSGAIAQFPQKHNLIVGLGTCITFNFINKFNEFLGGAISPGLYLRLKSLNDYTALLPMVEPNWNFPLIGYDTKTNIQSGVILGMSKEIDGVIEEYKERYNNLNVLITGGDLPFFHNHIRSKIISDPYLIYKGLYYISKNNAQ
ncbi:MAG: type III pantothenate kinase [Arachidicoccus sp.]|nr:type III pantothenate kinase [Arachidicoccus sp.]